MNTANQPKNPPKVSRPHMPGYGIAAAREGAGLLPWVGVEQRMAQARNYWVATTRPDGRPHATPVWGVWLDGTFYFGAEGQSRKARNLAANPYIVVHLESGDDVVILEGVAELVSLTDGELAVKLDATFFAKYAIHLPSEASVYVLRPYTAYAWLEKDFLNTATRWQW